MTKGNLGGAGEHKLGKYILASKGAINNIVEKQNNASLAHGDENKRIGELLIEQGVMTQEELDNSVKNNVSPDLQHLLYSQHYRQWNWQH